MPFFYENENKNLIASVKFLAGIVRCTLDVPNEKVHMEIRY